MFLGNFKEVDVWIFCNFVTKECRDVSQRGYKRSSEKTGKLSSSSTVIHSKVPFISTSMATLVRSKLCRLC